MIDRRSAPSIPGAKALEALIALKGDVPSADAQVRTRVAEVTLLALGEPDQWGLAHLLHCTVPMGAQVIAMLPVFTRLDYLMGAVQMNPEWRVLHVVEVEGEVILRELESREWLGINPWSGREFKLPSVAPVSDTF